ncbi:MAG: hypothetical protein GY849_15645, partial [Deltaproteobacteria bacterium]|nr:hypothetical protein [Deltaproteobacteria bacterium]
MKACRISFIAVFFITIVFFLSGPPMAYSAGKAPYKIGVNLELTGPWANVTKTLKAAMEMEVERVNNMGGV